MGESSVESGARDSLQDIIFDTEETERVRRREEELEREELTEGERNNAREDCSPCLQCKEKRKRNYSVRFNLNLAEEKRRKKKSLFELIVTWFQKLRRKLKSARLC